MRNRPLPGVTLVELLVTIAIIGLLLALLIPAVQHSRESARRTSCANNQQNVAKAILQYETRMGEFPGYRSVMAVDQSGTPRTTSWVFSILSDLGQPTVYQWHGPIGPDASRGTPVNLRIQNLLCPSDAQVDFYAGQEVLSATSYVVNAGQRDVLATASVPADWRENGIFQDGLPYGSTMQPVTANRVTISSIQTGDGLSQTLLLSENIDAGSWIDGSENNAGFIWEPRLGDDGGWPATLAPINQRPQVISPVAQADWLPQAGSLSQADWLPRWRYVSLMGCWSCGLGYRPPPPVWPPELPPEPPAAVPSAPAVPVVPQGSELARPSSYHTGGVMATYADGHTRFLSQKVSYLVYCQLMSSRGSQAAFPGVWGGKKVPVDEAFRSATVDPTVY